MKNSFPTVIAMLIWCGTIVSGNIVHDIHTDHWEHFLFDCYFCAFFFLPQLATMCILGKSYRNMDSTVQRRILILLGVLHCGLMLGDMALLSVETDVLCWGCFMSSIVFFLGTGIYLMILRQRWKGIFVALLSLIAWLQPAILWAGQQ